MVALAGVREIEQGLAHRLESDRLAVQLFGAGERQPLDVGALARAVRPQAEQRADVLDREAEIARVGDEAQAVDVGLRIVAIAAVAARRRRDQADLLVMADHPLRDRARLRGLADIPRFTAFGRNALSNKIERPAGRESWIQYV